MRCARLLSAAVLNLRAALGVLLLAVITANAPQAEPLPAGGLTLALQPGLIVESVDITITPQNVRYIYRVLNSGKTAKTTLATFALPEIDRFALAEDGGYSVLRDPVNLIGAVTLADNEPVAIKAQQRAYALGLDVTSAIVQAKLALLPLDPVLEAQIAALSPATVIDLTERGILQFEDGRLRPGWSLQTTGHWRQTIQAGKTLVIDHVYTPFVSTVPLTEATIARAIERACLPQITAEALKNRISAVPPPQLTTVAVTPSIVPGQELPGRQRIRIELPEGVLAVSTCLEPLARPDGRTIEWVAQGAPLDQEVTVVIVK